MKFHIQINTPFINCDWRHWHTLLKKAGGFTKNSNWYLHIMYCKGVLFEFNFEPQSASAIFNEPRGLVLRAALLGLVIDFKTGLWYSTADPIEWRSPLKSNA